MHSLTKHYPYPLPLLQYPCCFIFQPLPRPDFEPDPYLYPLILMLADVLRKEVLLVLLPPRPVGALEVAATERWGQKGMR